MPSFTQLFGVQLIDKEVVTPSGGLPFGLPAGFLNQTNPTDGNTVTYNIYGSCLDTAGEADYGGPAKRVKQQPKSQQSAILMHSIEEMAFSQNILNQIVGANGVNDEKGKREVLRQTGEFIRRFMNRRKAMIMSALAYGKIYTDGERILPNSTGAVRTIDLQVPATNTGNCNGIIDVTWENSAAKIGTQVENLQAAAAAAGNPPLKFAAYAGSISDNIQGNALIAKLVQGGFGRADFTTGVISDMFGLTWYPVASQFIRDASGVAVNPFAKKVVFHPEVTRDWYELREGSYVVGTGQTTAGTSEELLAQLAKNYGMFSYANWGGNPRTIVQTAGDTCLPIFYVPNAIYIATVLP